MAAEPIGKEDRMHGSIFVLLKRFVENKYHYSTWINLVEQAAIPHPSYQMSELYPTREIFAILAAASQQTGISFELMEQFGKFLVPDLLLIYKKYLQPQWRTYELLLKHGTSHARSRAPGRSPGRSADVIGD